MFKKLTVVITSLCLIAALGVNALADSGVAKGNYEKDYAAYKVFYNGTYMPAYHAYNDKLSQFANSVAAMDLQTVDDYNKIMDFINRLRSERHALFGDRVTPGTSRYEVAKLRSTMMT